MAGRFGAGRDGHGNGGPPAAGGEERQGLSFWPRRRHRGSLRGALISHNDPKSAPAEAYRSLRTAIQFAHIDRPCRSIVITSASAGEGKTTTAANFAVVSAQSGQKVCLVDADLRRPGQHRAFGLENTRGLTTALLEEFPLADVAQPTLLPTLQVVTSGPIPPNPAELAGSARMRQLIEDAATAFDLVILDSPPVIPVSDGIALSAHAEGVIMVVKVGTVPSEVVRRAVEQIEAVKGRVLGVVLNRVNPRRDGDYYYQHYRYNNAYYGDNGRR